MKKTVLGGAFCIILLLAMLLMGSTCQSRAKTETDSTGGIVLLSYTGDDTGAGEFNVNLPNSPYGYETWDYRSSKGLKSTNKFTWYGPDQRGGGAFKAEWTDYFLARLGFFWGNGNDFTQYKNIYIDYDFKRSNNASTYGGFIGMYGWSRNAPASKDIEKLIEYYIVDDWFWDGQLEASNIYQKYDGVIYGKELGSFEADGAVYKIYTTERHNEPSIDGTRTFTQIFSVRQGRRTKGTISVTEHFKEWSKYTELGNLYEVKFKVEAFGGNGYLDLSYLHLSQEESQR